MKYNRLSKLMKTNARRILSRSGLVADLADFVNKATEIYIRTKMIKS